MGAPTRAGAPAGISARTTVPLEGRDRTSSRPPSAATRSARPVSPLPAAGSAPPTPSSRTSITTRSRSRRTVTSAAAARGVLGDVGQRLRHDEVGRRLDRRRERRIDVRGDRHRQRRPCGEGVEPGGQPALGEDRGMDAAGELAQLREPGGELDERVVEQRRRAGARLRVLAREVEHDRERDEALLGAVVQVALEPPARRVTRRHEPRARRLQLVDPCAQLGGEPLVLERERRRRAGGAHQLAVVVERRIVDDRGDRLAVALDLRDRTAVAGHRQRHGVALCVDVAAGVGQPVGERERVVAERIGERVARADPAEPSEQGVHRARAREAGAQQPGEEGERQRGHEDDQHRVDGIRHLLGAEQDRDRDEQAEGADRRSDPQDGGERAALHLPERRANGGPARR